MREYDREALFRFMGTQGYQTFFDGLAEVAADRVKDLAGTEDRSLRTEMRQWERTGRRLKELADWCREFGPGSGCR
jgi:hypothetical protein